MASIQNNPGAIAYDFLGHLSTYEQFGKDIDQCARGLANLGVQPGDRVTISMLTTPHVLTAVYAVNKLGAVSTIIHPYVVPKQVENYLQISKSKFVLTLNAFYGNFTRLSKITSPEASIVVKIEDYLDRKQRRKFRREKGHKIPKLPLDLGIYNWSALMYKSFPNPAPVAVGADDLAVILYSGGVSGFPKGILLSNRNINAQGMQFAAWSGIHLRSSMLNLMPFSSAYGLSTCHAMLGAGGKCILVPWFTPPIIAKLIIRKHPSHLVGIPGLFSNLNQNLTFLKSYLGFLKSALSGTISLPIFIKLRFEEIVRKNGGNIQLLDSYGLTETSGPICASPHGDYRGGAVGIPFPDDYVKIVQLESKPPQEVNWGQDGEICVHGPTVMIGYLDKPEETARVLRVHEDGLLWLHTGDIGTMDEDGFIYFKSRIKRVIERAGNTIYLSEIEDILNKNPEIRESAVISIPDEQLGQKIKSFIVLKNQAKSNARKAREIISYCRERLTPWSCPEEIEFLPFLPRTIHSGELLYSGLESRSPRKAPPTT